MNAPRILLGGLLAGLLFNVLGIASSLVFNLQEAFNRLGWVPGPATLYIHLTTRFALGIAAVFLYAAIRPRFGPGLKTAVIAGLYLWFVGYLLTGILLIEIGVFELGQGIWILLWGLVEAPLATSAGARLYREKSDVPCFQS